MSKQVSASALYESLPVSWQSASCQPPALSSAPWRRLAILFLQVADLCSSAGVGHHRSDTELLVAAGPTE